MRKPFLLGLFLAAAMLCHRVSVAMEIEMFDAMAPQDQRDYLEYLVDNATRIFVEQSRGDSAVKADQLFPKKVSGGCRSQGEVLFHASLTRARAYAAENPNSPFRTAVEPLTNREPVVTTLTIENPLSEPVSVELGQRRVLNIVLDVRMPSGLGFLRSLTPRMAGTGGSSTITIQPRGSYQQQLVLNEWERFDELGAYRVSAIVAGLFMTTSGGRLEPPFPATVAFSIAPRDEGALRAKAAKLTQVVVNAPTAQERINAERILAAIVDPVVVPFLAEVLERTTVSDYAVIHALGRIGSPEKLIADQPS